MKVPVQARRAYQALRSIPRILQTQPRSQYAEDSLFFAAFNPRRSGFYVDVGAHHPVSGSNTYRLYRHGWSGLTIEPNPSVEIMFREARPRDIHICAGVSRGGGGLEYFEYAHSVYNTFSETRVADLAQSGIMAVDTRIVETRPLHELLDQHSQGRHVDLLTIDCEGLDLDVLFTANLVDRPPTTVLVEDWAGYKNFQAGERRSPIDEFMRGHGYQPVAQALLTTLYVSNAWRELFGRSSAFSPSDIQVSLLP